MHASSDLEQLCSTTLLRLKKLLFDTTYLLDELVQLGLHESMRGAKLSVACVHVTKSVGHRQRCCLHAWRLDGVVGIRLLVEVLDNLSESQELLFLLCNPLSGPGVQSDVVTKLVIQVLNLFT